MSKRTISNQFALFEKARRRQTEITKTAIRRSRMKKGYAPVRHIFWLEVTNGDGEVEAVPIKALVKRATRPVELTVTEEHVREAIRRNGAGSSTQCTMAICCYKQKDAFPHQVEGHVDWSYSRAYVVSKLNEQRLPAECVAYEHDSQIARMNDSTEGFFKLLKRIEKEGPIRVRLFPYRQHGSHAGPGPHRTTTGVRQNIRGANLRFAVANLNGPPKMK